MISVGIDVSKGKSMVCIMKPGGEVLKTPFEIRHTISELEDLVSLIKSYPEEVRVIVEDTGHYHWPIVEQLTNSGIFVSSVNALRMKKYCSQSIRKAKTDRIDSIHIASYGITYWSELITFQPAERTYKELKVLSRQFYQSTNMYVKAKVSLNTLLDQAMPDIVHIMSNNGTNHKLTDFVERYWHYGYILEMVGKSRFRTDYCRWAKNRDTASTNVWQTRYSPWLKAESLSFRIHRSQR